MNTVKKSVLAFGSMMLVAMQSFAVTPPVKSPLKVQMYQVVDTYKMNVTVEKSADEPLTVTLKDKNQKLVHKHTIASKSSLLSQKIDFEDLEDGVYYLTISDGASEVVKEIQFSTKNASELTYHTLIAQN